ncbi:hypothetical protein LWC33_23390 [Pseudonocardia sp. RS11V-5]|uniref:hypothetical protein n=1 Tax=Pseudonocardia terrae TaxID=2905831 RepID=UPI001E2C2ECB|nr:hypothetical protein [Pseudonocardia terrae]MCE3554387.1 hypothetical protein [Pseudonocardia terrae]
MARRMGGKGGGNKKGSSGGGSTLALGLGIALLASAGMATAVGNAASSGAATVAAGGSPGTGSGSLVGSANSTAAETRIVGQGVRLSAKVTDDSADCVTSSYGQVQDFFRRTPCTALHRAFFELRDQKSDAAVVSVAWVEMPDESSARALNQLMDTTGTGNVTELSRERSKYRTVRYTGDSYASRQDGQVVINAQAEPVARRWTGVDLSSIATTAAQ